MKPQDAVKTDEMINVGMGDKYIIDFEDIPHRKICGKPEIKQEGLPFPQAPDVQSRVFERTIEKSRMKGWFHKQLYLNE